MTNTDRGSEAGTLSSFIRSGNIFVKKILKNAWQRSLEFYETTGFCPLEAGILGLKKNGYGIEVSGGRSAFFNFEHCPGSGAKDGTAGT